MSRQIDTKNASRLSEDDLQYAVQRDLLTPAQLVEVDLDTPEKVAAFLTGTQIDLADRPYSGNHLILSDEEIDLIQARREKALKAPIPTIKGSTAVVDEEDLDYDSMTNDELRTELAGRERDLSVEGKKQELIDRLREDDAAQLLAASNEQQLQS